MGVWWRNKRRELFAKLLGGEQDGRGPVRPRRFEAIGQLTVFGFLQAIARKRRSGDVLDEL